MEYGICVLNAIPIRETIQHQSEMVTQMLFGETCIIEEKFQNWLKIRTTDDHYEGWIDSKQILFINESFFQKVEHESCFSFVKDPSSLLKHTTDSSKNVWLSMGASLPLIQNNELLIGNEAYIYTGNIITSEQKSNEKICSIAKQYLHAPYLWGGRSFWGVDCSGLTQITLKMCGISLPRDASQQVNAGHEISFIENATPGDLLFFDNTEGKIIHTGIYLGEHLMIHASGEVRIDTIDHQGIFNKDKTCYTHQLRSIRRLC